MNPLMRRIEQLERERQPSGAIVIVDKHLGMTTAEAYALHFGPAGPPPDVSRIIVIDPAIPELDNDGPKCGTPYDWSDFSASERAELIEHLRRTPDEPVPVWLRGQFNRGSWHSVLPSPFEHDSVIRNPTGDSNRDSQT